MSDASNTMNGQFSEELSLLVRSGYPYLYVTSFEEDRVIKILERLGEKLSRPVFVWSRSRGLHNSTTERQPVRASKQLCEGIEDIQRYQGAALFVVLDAHHLLEPVEIARQLVDLQTQLERDEKTIFFVGIEERIPKELKKDFYSIHFPLPTLEELMEASREIENELDEEHQESIARAVLGLTLREARRAYRKSKVKDGRLSLDDIESIAIEKKRLIGQDGALQFYNFDENMENVGGLKNLKEWVDQRNRAFSREAQEFGLPIPRGILLLGVQGCGKSLSCKAIAEQWRMPLLRLDLGSVYGSYVGMSEENIRNAIRMAEMVAPCILWVDEIEKGLAGLGSSDHTDAGTTSRVFSTILTWMQEKKAPVFVTATANRLTGLPPELLRRGRFDEIFFVDLPNDEERAEIIRIHIRKHKRDPGNYRIESLVGSSQGYSGAEIEQAIINALYQAFADRTDLTDAHLLSQFQEIIPLSQTMAEEIQTLQRWAYKRARPASK